ncbi:HAUS augmin-like complex subunit 6 N-terminus-domain-containing protein [Chaetomidium leptoderma]|uniref:HAUS augmin-like complex subunit 6 N-terminus-domain-containing protein n=1 Tax=Chaetomidium leptoderma TaxID=669021 RepID=A0AAN6VIY2_9PEZI|nr:HAUS augmin-like complex subunit 6 N-terminus-domain-containing protein [Chaetomidium leptoderma]
MAHPSGISLLSRTRSTRAPANVSKPAQSASRGTAPGAIPTTTATHPTASPTAVSNLSLFLTNLRLLDLDRRPDWPDINALTFGTRDAAQGQKKRIQSVEWALYHLFRLWDPDEARHKLQPFFPPLDQVQSLNLRAALLRGLEQAKKNGVLGRDAVVRRTMLDECKGERLEEVLAVLSSAVLKKSVAERQLNGGAGHPALAQTLALENRGYSGERVELTALVLAHRVSLRRVLVEKNAARERFREFSDLLASKEEALAARREEAEAAKRNGQKQAVSDDQRREIWRTVRNNWTGNERWMEALMYGDSNSRKDGVLTTPYDRVWRRVQAGRLAELEDTSAAGLLAQLDSRVRGQQARLEKWQGFRHKMFGKPVSESATKVPEQQPPKQTGIYLGFRAHENLHLGRMSPRKLTRTKPSQLDSHYEALINGLKSDLGSISPAIPSIPRFFQRPPRDERIPPRNLDDDCESEVISDISELEETQPLPRSSPSRRELIRVSEEPAFEPVLRKAKTFDDEHAFPDEEPVTPSRLRRSATIQAHSPSIRRRRILDSPTHAPEQRLDSAPRPKPAPSSPHRSTRSPPRLISASPEPAPSPESPISPTQELADQILASVSAASPSPIKKPRHRLSLAERTRMSMARRTSHANLRVPADEDGPGGYGDDDDDNEDDEEPDAPRLAIKRAPMTVPIVNEPPPSPPPPPGAAAERQDDGADGDAAYAGDLSARTRRSMAGFEAARQRAQLERRRSLRKAKQGPSPSTPLAAGRGNYFDAVDENEEEGNTTVLAEELMTGGRDDDYEAVFMSRPKLKTSPIGTPVRELWD